MKETTFTVHVEEYIGANILPEEQFVAWVEEKEYKGMVVTSDSISGCFKELSISLKVKELYEQQV